MILQFVESRTEMCVKFGDLLRNSVFAFPLVDRFTRGQYPSI